MFEKMQTCNDQLPAYDVLEAKLRAKRILKALMQKTVERHLWWKVIGIHLVIQGIVDFKFNKTQMFFSRGLNNKYHCLMAQGNNSNNFQNTNSFSTTRQLGHNSTNNH
jgi:hypothetical protein